jgi:hypothetical protein
VSVSTAVEMCTWGLTVARRIVKLPEGRILWNHPALTLIIPWTHNSPTLCSMLLSFWSAVSVSQSHLLLALSLWLLVAADALAAPSMAPVEKLKRFVLLTTSGTDGWLPPPETGPDPEVTAVVAAELSFLLVSPTEELLPVQGDDWAGAWGLRLSRLRFLSLFPSMTASTKALPGEYSDLLLLRGGVRKTEKEVARRGLEEGEPSGVRSEVSDW